MSDKQRDYNKSAKGRARKAAYRQRNRHRIAAADRERTVRERAERRRWLDDYKMQRGCADCGYKKHPKALDFDHVRGEKLGDIGRLSHTSIAWSRLMAEIAKCEVVCANCHRIRTHNRDQHRSKPKELKADLARERFAQGVLDFGATA